MGSCKAFLLFLIVMSPSWCIADQVSSLRVHSSVPAGPGKREGLHLPLTEKLRRLRPLPLIRRLTIDDGFPEAIFNDMQESRDGTIWMATEFGLYSFNGHEVRHFDTGALQHGACIQINDRSEDEEIWVGTTTGLAVLSLKHRQVTYIERFRGVAIERIGIDHLPRPLVVSDGDLYVKVDDQFSKATFSSQPSAVQSVHDGQLWVGSACGLFCQDSIGQPLRSILGKDRLLGSYLLDASNGHLWAGFMTGPCRIDRKNGVIQPFQSEDVFGPAVIHRCCLDGESTWFASNHGLFRQRTNTIPPDLVVDRITTDKELRAGDQVQASTDNKLVTVKFHAVTPGMRNGTNLYRYRLRGQSGQWSETRENEIELRDLPVVKHVLELQAFDRDLAASRIASVPIQVSVPKLRYAAYGLLGFSLFNVACAVGYVVFNQRRQNKLMKVRVNEAVSTQLKLEEELRQSQKLESLGTLASGMAHDLNNALQVVSICVDLAKRNSDRDRIMINLEMIEDAAAQAEGLTRSMLTMAGQGPRQTALADLNELTLDCLKLIRQTTRQSIEIETRNNSSNKEILVDVDAVQIKQVLVNLLLNARDAMPNGGLLLVTVQSLTKDDLQWAQIEIRDTGEGISAENLDRIFEPFYTTKPREKGTGLGLAMVQGIVKSHNGSISVESKRNVGTSFRLRLPQIATSLPKPFVPAEEFTAPVDTGTLPRVKVLVADDRDILLASMVRTLEELEFDVLTADNGARALEVACKSHPDVLVLDIDMPILDGITALRKIRSAGYETPAIMVSGAPVQDDLPTNTSILLKPFKAEQLCDAVKGKVLASIS